MFYVNLVLTIVAMMTVVAIVAMPIGPIVRRPIVVAVVRICPVVTVWIVAVAVRIITISVSRITNSDPDSPNTNRYLSV